MFYLFRESNSLSGGRLGGGVKLTLMQMHDSDTASHHITSSLSQVSEILFLYTFFFLQFQTMFRSIVRQPFRFNGLRIASRFNSVNFKINTESHVYKYLDQAPKFVKFTSEHEWIAVHEDSTAFIGITNYAADALGDTTFVELPEIGASYETGESIGGVESVKSASEIYSPVSGEVVGINDILESKPQLINEDPMGAGWIAHIKLQEPIENIEAQEDLMDETTYVNSLDH